MKGQPNFFSLPQGQETPVVFQQQGWLHYRYAYARSTDSRTNNENGQDYLAFSVTPDRFVFALCDGVSQSFYGDLAARILGDKLTELFLRLDLSVASEHIEHDLLSELNALTDAASLQVRDHSLPADLAPMLAGVLEKKRQMGSESTFVAGVLDFQKNLACFAWMGDSRLRIWQDDSELTASLGDTFHTNERWSSKKGPVPVGALHLHIRPVSQITHLVAYSDGFSYLDEALNQAGFVRPFSHRAIDQFMVDASKRPSSDDISFLEIWLGKTPKFPHESETLPAPFVEAGGLVLDGDFCALDWQPVNGASGYEVQVASDAGTLFSQATKGNSWQSTTLDRQARFVTVRAWMGSEPGLWSRPLELPSRSAPGDGMPPAGQVISEFPPVKPESPAVSVPPASEYRTLPRQQTPPDVASFAPPPAMPPAAPMPIPTVPQKPVPRPKKKRSVLLNLLIIFGSSVAIVCVLMVGSLAAFRLVFAPPAPTIKAFVTATWVSPIRLPEKIETPTPPGSMEVSGEVRVPVEIFYAPGESFHYKPGEIVRLKILYSYSRQGQCWLFVRDNRMQGWVLRTQILSLIHISTIPSCEELKEAPPEIWLPDELNFRGTPTSEPTLAPDDESFNEGVPIAPSIPDDSENSTP